MVGLDWGLFPSDPGGTGQSRPLLGPSFELTSLAGFLQVPSPRRTGGRACVRRYLSMELLVAVQSIGSALQKDTHSA